MMDDGLSGCSGSRAGAPSQSSLSRPIGFDPGRVAPPAYQAEVLRQQICDDVNRRFWRARQRLAQAFEDRKDQVQHDHEKLSAPDFLAKYEGHRFL